jgi:leucyl aminopeptidase
MQILFDVQPVTSVACDTAVLIAFEEQPPEQAPELVKELYNSKEFSGKSLETALLHRPEGFAAKRLLLIGAGKRERFTPADIRKAAGVAARTLKSKNTKQVCFVLPVSDDPEFSSAAAEGAILGHYDPDVHKTDKNGDKSIDSFTLLAGQDSDALRQAVNRGCILAESQNLARELVNEPSNRLTPMTLAERAQAMAAAQGLECEILDQDRMRQLGMGALLGVAMGSAQPPALIVLRYKPASESAVHLALLGKGVTFDSGGLSIKPADGMEKMKYDMAGGAAVIGAMQAIAQFKPSIAVTALIPAVENMTGSRAQRPGDIVKTLNGKTVEVLNTDAEGRLILADAIAYARNLGATHLVDAATLTGAIVVALGHHRIGLFTNDDGLKQRIERAAGLEGERMWQMPLDDDYKDYLKSAFADLPNVGPRWGGAISAAMFLKEFAAPTPWVHLDIAGTAWMDDGKSWQAKGPTGVTVRTLARLACDWSEATPA